MYEIIVFLDGPNIKILCRIIPTDSIPDNIPVGNFVCGPLRYDSLHAVNKDF